MSCSRCFCVLFFTFCPLCVLFGVELAKRHFLACVCRYRPQYPVLSVVPVHEVRVFPVFPLVLGSVGVNLQAYTYFVFPNASTYLYKYFPSVRWLSPVCRIRPLLSRLFSFMVSAPFLVGKSLDMTCVHHNTYKAHLH